MFKVGDLVWCLCQRWDFPKQGWLPGVISGLTNIPDLPYDVTVDGVTHTQPENGLRPRDPPRKERQELGEWDLCPWSPRESVVSETPNE